MYIVQSCLETKEYSYAYGLVEAYNVAKHLLTTAQSLRIFTVNVCAVVNILRDRTEFTKYDVMSIKYYQRGSVSMP